MFVTGLRIGAVALLLPLSVGFSVAPHSAEAFFAPPSPTPTPSPQNPPADPDPEPEASDPFRGPESEFQPRRRAFISDRSGPAFRGVASDDVCKSKLDRCY